MCTNTKRHLCDPHLTFQSIPSQFTSRSFLWPFLFAQREAFSFCASRRWFAPWLGGFESTLVRFLWCHFLHVSVDCVSSFLSVCLCCRGVVERWARARPFLDGPPIPVSTCDHQRRSQFWISGWFDDVGSSFPFLKRHLPPLDIWHTSYLELPQSVFFDL